MSVVIISFAVVKSASRASTTIFVTMSLSETIPINLFSLSTMGTAPIFLFLISRAISLTGVSV